MPGCPGSVPALTINKVCGSGLKAVMLAAQAIKAGDAQCVVAGGQEAMSASPHYLFGLRNGIKAGNQTMRRRHDPRRALGLLRRQPHGRLRRVHRAEGGHLARGPGPVRVREPPEGRRRHRGRRVQGGDRAGRGARQEGPDASWTPTSRPARTPPRGAGQAQAGVPEGRHRHGGQRARAQRRRERAGRDLARLRQGARTRRRWRGSPPTPPAAASPRISSSRRSSRCRT